MEVEQNIWGFTKEGEAVILYTITNSRGESVKVTNIGAALVGVTVLDRNGKLDDVVLGYPDFNDYINDSASMGITVGRYANRIAKGRFTLNGKEYRLAVNNGQNHLHGGRVGFGAKLWASRTEGDMVVFSLTSPDGEENYPGELGVEVGYTWSDDARLQIVFMAKCDAPTIVNLTNHAYFNLKGEGNGDIHDHYMQLNASKYLPIDETIIPTGELADVAGTPMDFTKEKLVGKDINELFEQLKIAKGYDHSWVIDNWSKGKMLVAGTLYEPTTGRELRVETTQPGIQIYTGNYLSGAGKGKCGKEYEDRSGIAMECQLFPDTPNKPHFPTAVLNPDEIYEEYIAYQFGIRK